MSEESTALAVKVEQALIEGDLSKLSVEEKVHYYLRVCESVGLNPYTKPFDYLVLNGRTILYANKNATDQLRSKRHVSVTNTNIQQIGDVYVVTASARDADGRTDSSMGAVTIYNLKGLELANAMMRAETKAKRRVTLSLCGLGMLDESEIDSVRNSYRVEGPQPQLGGVDRITGEVLERYEPQPPPTEDRDLVRSADDQAWESWIRIKDQALELGLKVQDIHLGVERQTLRDYAKQVIADISARKREAAALPRR